MITRSYDAVIVFPSPGAFTAAAMLAAQGKQVLVVARPGQVEPGKYRFPSHRRVLAGIGGGVWLAQALREIQVHPRDIQALRRSSPMYQVVDPDHRMDVPSGPEALRAEVGREFGPRAATAAINLLSRLEEAGTAHAEAITTSLSAETSVGFWGKIGVKKVGWSEPRDPDGQRQTLGEAAETEEVPPELLRVIAAPLFALSGVANPVEELSVARAGLLLLEAMDGLYQNPANPDAFHELLRRRVEGIKVDITGDDQPEEFVLGWGRLKEIRFAGRKQPVRAEALITGADPSLLGPWLSGSAADEYSAASLDLVPTHFLHCLRLGIAEEVIPEGMCDHVFLLGGGDDGPDNVFLSMTPSHSDGAPEGRRAMTVSCRLPLELAEDSRQLDLVSRAMLDRVKELMPYLERYIEVIHLPQVGERSSANPFPVDPRPVVFDAGPKPRRAAGVSLPHKNVFYCGRGASPALGLDGEVMAGMAVARLAAQVIRKGR